MDKEVESFVLNAVYKSIRAAIDKAVESEAWPGSCYLSSDAIYRSAQAATMVIMAAQENMDDAEANEIVKFL